MFFVEPGSGAGALVLLLGATVLDGGGGRGVDLWTIPKAPAPKAFLPVVPLPVETKGNHGGVALPLNVEEGKADEAPAAAASVVVVEAVVGVAAPCWLLDAAAAAVAFAGVETGCSFSSASFSAGFPFVASSICSLSSSSPNEIAGGGAEGPLGIFLANREVAPAAGNGIDLPPRALHS